MYYVGLTSELKCWDEIHFKHKFDYKKTLHHVMLSMVQATCKFDVESYTKYVSQFRQSEETDLIEEAFRGDKRVEREMARMAAVHTVLIEVCSALFLYLFSLLFKNNLYPIVV